jgi:HlyD family secretion protein
MDRVIPKKKWTRRKISWLVAALLTLFFLVWFIFLRDTSSKLYIDSSKFIISEVVNDNFQEYIPVDGVVQPIKTIHLDVVNGGQVEKIYVEDGAMLEEGDTILKLSNINLQLDYMNRETQMVDIINNLQNTKLKLEQNHFILKKQLLELDFQLDQAKKEFLRVEKLYEKDMVSDQDYEDAKRSFQYAKRQRSITIESQKHDSLAALLQIQQLKRSLSQMEKNMTIVRENLANLYVKAPVSGMLSSFNAEIGESKVPGQNIGQIDVLDGFKLNAPVDERYISRVYTGQPANFDLNDKTYNLTIKKIYPDVVQGNFRVDFHFTDSVPQTIKKGQTISVKLEFSGLSQSTLIRKGNFFQHTGGNWIYVLKDGVAEKRDITIGRQNAIYYEVKEGLLPGEEVIISGYKIFGDKEKLVISN